MSLVFCPRSTKPDSLAIYKSSDYGKTWQPFQYFSTQCRRFYGRPNRATITKNNEQEVLCSDSHQYNKDTTTLQGSRIAFNTLEDDRLLPISIHRPSSRTGSQQQISELCSTGYNFRRSRRITMTFTRKPRNRQYCSSTRTTIRTTTTINSICSHPPQLRLSMIDKRCNIMHSPTFPLAVGANAMDTHHVAFEVSMDNWSANANTTRQDAIVKSVNYFISIDRGRAAHRATQTSVKVSKQDDVFST